MKTTQSIGYYEAPADWHTRAEFVYVGRHTDPRIGAFGIPEAFRGGWHRSQAESVALFEEYFLKRVELDRDFRCFVLHCRGLKLVPTMTKGVTNADIIAAWLNDHAEESIPEFRGWPIHPDLWLARREGADVETPGLTMLPPRDYDLKVLTL